MRVVISALIVLLVAGAAWAATPAEILKGAKSIHVIAPGKAMDDITDVFIAEIPDVTIEGSRETADVIVRFIVTSSTVAPAGSKQEQPPSPDRTGYTGKIGPAEDAQLAGDAIGTISLRDPKDTAVMFTGRITATSAKDFAREIVKAWKEANGVK